MHKKKPINMNNERECKNHFQPLRPITSPCHLEQTKKSKSLHFKTQMNLGEFDAQYQMVMKMKWKKVNFGVK
jgi:hypothetical protein